MSVLRAILLCLLWGLAAALAAFGLGVVWINTTSAGFEGSEAMGRAILMIYVLVPGGFVLGVAAGAIAQWRAHRRGQ